VIIIDPLPNTVKIDVSSGGWNLFRRTLWFSVDPLKIDLDNPADIRFLTRSTLKPIVDDQIEGLNINYLMTDTLFINVQRKVSREVQIMVDSITLPLTNSYRIVSPIEIDPLTVTLSGPETIINSLQDHYYVMPDINRIDDEVSEEVKIPLPFENLMESNPQTVNISFNVDRFDRARITVPLELLNFPEDSSSIISDTSVIISYTIQRDLTEEFTQLDFGVTLDFELLDVTDSTIQPILIYYPEIALELNISPGSIPVITRFEVE
jgi:YbbR domain-containing protein